MECKTLKQPRLKQSKQLCLGTDEKLCTVTCLGSLQPKFDERERILNWNVPDDGEREYVERSYVVGHDVSCPIELYNTELDQLHHFSLITIIITITFTLVIDYKLKLQILLRIWKYSWNPLKGHRFIEQTAYLSSFGCTKTILSSSS